METERVLFLIIGIVVVAAVGRLLKRGGGRYIASAESGDGRAARASATLVSVMFHLITLGVVALLAVLDLPGGQAKAFLLRLGILLLVLAVAYGITLNMLRNRRQEEVVVDLDQRMREAEAEAEARHPDRHAAANTPEYAITNDPPPVAERPLRREPLA